MCDQAHIDRACGQLAGLAPDTLIAKMIEHGDAARLAHRIWETTGDRACRAFVRDERLMEAAARLRLAIDFGTSRGWALTTRAFGLKVLGAGQMYGRMSWGPCDYPGNFLDALDHPYFYRCGRKAAGIAAHPYDYSHERCAEIALRFGLSFETPAFPSWWNPPQTRLVAFIGPAGRDGSRTPNVRRCTLAEREAAA